jgi:hypothetical protein
LATLNLTQAESRLQDDYDALAKAPVGQSKENLSSGNAVSLVSEPHLTLRMIFSSAEFVL